MRITHKLAAACFIAGGIAVAYEAIGDARRDLAAAPAIVPIERASPDPAQPRTPAVNPPVAAPVSLCPCVACKCEPCECKPLNERIIDFLDDAWHPGTWTVCEGTSCRTVNGQVLVNEHGRWGYSDCGKMYRIKDGAGTLHAPPVKATTAPSRTMQRATGGACSNGSCGSVRSFGRGLFGRR
jgi:hypothetical protein